jgi:nucleolar pre-ribosomal-associated protein 1
VSPLIAVYRGTLSVPDRQLLDIFRLFEQNRKYSCSSIISQWTPTRDIPQSGILNAITNLDASLLFATCTNFPQWRAVDSKSSLNPTVETQKALYDPLFIILLLGLVNQANGTTFSVSGMDWVQLFRSNIVCVLISCLSSRQESLRTLAWNVFGGLLIAIQVSSCPVVNGSRELILRYRTAISRSRRKHSIC